MGDGVKSVGSPEKCMEEEVDVNESKVGLTQGTVTCTINYYAKVEVPQNITGPVYFDFTFHL